MANSYPAQEYFPDACKECPKLVGFIEDGDLLGSVTKDDVARHFSEMGIAEDVLRCTGPLAFEIEGDKGSACQQAFIEGTYRE